MADMDRVLELGYTEEDIRLVKSQHRLVHYTDITLYNKIKKIYLYLLEYGFNKHEVLNITRTFMGIFSYEIETLEHKIKELKDMGLTDTNVKKMIKESPKVLSLSVANIKLKISFLEELGYKHEEVMKMIKNNSSILEKSTDTIRKKIENLMGLGYSYEQVIKITKSESLIYRYDINFIVGRLNDIMTLGYTKQEVLLMFYKFPQIVYGSITRMREKMKKMIELGFTKEEIKEISLKLPAIYIFDVDAVIMKKEFYDSIGLCGVIVNDPLQLIQSVDVSYARYKFLKSINVEVTMENYRLLFMNEKRFAQRYGVTKQEIVKQYNFDQDYANGKINVKRS